MGDAYKSVQSSGRQFDFVFQSVLQQFRALMTDQQSDIDKQFFELITAIKNSSYEEVERILRSAHPTIVNRLEVQFRQPALYFAALSQGDEASVELIKLLVRNGASINHKDHNEQTILFYICREGKEKCAELLLSHGLSLDQVDVYGQTPLFYAASENRLQIVRKYSTKDRVNHPDKLAGQTPLFYAARRGNLQMCKILVEKGADVSHIDTTNKNSLEYAKKAKFPDVVDFLTNEFKKLKQNAKIMNSASVEESSIERKKRHFGGLKDLKQTYKIVLMTEKGDPHDLTEGQVADLIKQKPELLAYLSNPDSIPQDAIYERDCWETAAGRITTQCCKIKGAYYFQQPVDPIKFNVPDYLDIIKTPMDLGTVKKKLSHNVYTAPQQFVDEIKLIWQNSYQYNGTEHVVSKAAKQLETTFVEACKTHHLAKFLPSLQLGETSK